MVGLRCRLFRYEVSSRHEEIFFFSWDNTREFDSSFVPLTCVGVRLKTIFEYWYRDVTREQANGDAVSGPVEGIISQRASEVSDATRDSTRCDSGQIFRSSEHEDSFLIETQQMERRRQIMEWTRLEKVYIHI